MLKQSSDLDATFQALADPTRRQMVERLSGGPATVSELAAPLAMSLAAVMQHLTVLERGGLVRSEKIGRVRTVRLEPEALEPAEAWIAERKAMWQNKLDRLGVFLDDEAAADAAALEKAIGWNTQEPSIETPTTDSPTTEQE